jgi:hypothetical protein
MFPNVRLMIVAVLASIMGISCALALFAEFRISRDSFLRESNAAAPLQLSAGGPAAVINAAATFGGRFEAQPALPAPPLVSLPRQEMPAVPAGATRIPPETTATSSPTSLPPTSGGAPASGTVASKSADPHQIPSSTPADRPADTPPEKPVEKPAEKPVENLADRTPAVSPAKPEPPRAAPKIKIAPQGAAAAAAKRRTTLRHRPLIVRRTPRPRPAAPVQTFTATQSVYQWAPGQLGQPAQPVRRRVIVKRVRPLRKTEQTPPTAISATSAANAPQ